MRLRMVSLADAEALAAIYRPYVEETTITFEEAAPDELEFRRRIEEITAFYPYLVAEEAGHVVGYAYAHRAFERAAYRYDAEVSVYVARKCGKQGIGTHLYRALLALLTLQNIILCFGLISVPNLPSEKLHQKLGFMLRSSMPCVGYKRGTWCQVDYYEKQLNPFEPRQLLSIKEIGAKAIAEILQRESLEA